MKSKWIGLGLALSLGLSGCDFMRALGYGYGELSIQPGVFPLTELNTAYDDYNATAPPDPLQTSQRFLYASNASSQGKHFDLHAGEMSLYWSYPSGYSRPDPPDVLSRGLGVFLPEANSEQHEWGPSLLLLAAAPESLPADVFMLWPSAEFRKPPGQAELQKQFLSGPAILSFTSDRQGQRDLFLWDSEAQKVLPLGFNSAQAEDSYLSFDPARRTLYFSSDRGGSLDLYRLNVPNEVTDLKTWLQAPARAQEVEPVAELNSPQRESCPVFLGDLLVFASDRPGGQGGYDLYLSTFQNGKWQTPQNLQTRFPGGVPINTSSDEFRPALWSDPDLPRRPLMLFSSNRIGGKGGFDLYTAVWPELGMALLSPMKN
ncbi:MAG: TolB family protein [Candidatus Sericytochromatia bacterium]